MMIQSYPAGRKEFNGKLKPGNQGEAIVRNYLLTSDDDGAIWSAMKDVTESTKAADAITNASGPGIGIQLQRGEHKGRLIMPFNQRVGTRSGRHAVYSDDHGTTWKLGERRTGAPSGGLTWRSTKKPPKGGTTNEKPQ